MERREHREPRSIRAFCSAFDSRFQRFARTDMDSRLGSLMFPDTLDSDSYSETPADGLSYLSSAPYWARLRRLGNARLRRQQRFAGLQQNMARRAPLGAIRRLPDARPVGLPFMGLTGLMANDFEILHPLSPETSQEVSDPGTVEPSRTATPFQGARKSASPWFSGTFTPARVAAKPAKSRPLERIAERAPLTRQSVDKVRSVLQGRSAQLRRDSAVSMPNEHQPTRTGAPTAPRTAKREGIATVTSAEHLEIQRAASLALSWGPDTSIPADQQSVASNGKAD